MQLFTRMYEYLDYHLPAHNLTADPSCIIGDMKVGKVRLKKRHFTKIYQRIHLLFVDYRFVINHALFLLNLIEMSRGHVLVIHIHSNDDLLI